MIWPRRGELYLLATLLLSAAVLGALVPLMAGLFQLPAAENPWSLSLTGLGLLVLVPIGTVWLIRHPGAAVMLLGFAVWTNLSEVLVRFHGAPSLLQLAFVPILLAALLAVDADDLTRLLGSPLFVTASAFLLWNVASIWWAIAPVAATERVVELTKAWLLMTVVALLTATAGRLRRALWAIVVGGVLLAGLALLQGATGAFENQFGGFARVKDAQIFGEVFQPRVAGPLGDPNFFAQILLVLVPVALSLGWGGRSERADRIRRVLSLVAAALLLGGVLFTYSRGAAVALVVVLLLAPLLRGVRLRSLGLALALFLLLALILPFGFLHRLQTLSQVVPGVESAEVVDPDTSIAKRRLLTATAWEIFRQEPVLGVGAGGYGEAFFAAAPRVGTPARLYEDPGERNYAHNLYLETAAESGGIGLLLFLAVVAAAGGELLSVRQTARGAGWSESVAWSDGLALGLCGFLLTALFLHWHFPRYLFLLLGVSIGLGLTVARRRREPSESQISAPAATKQAEAMPGSGAREVQAAVGVVVSRFPKLTETFILREIEELERQGQPIRLVPLMRNRESVVHEEAIPWLQRALYTPWLSGRIVAANLRRLRRRPGAYLGLVARLVWGCNTSPGMLVKTLALIPKAVYLAERLPAEGVAHLHAHFATHPTTLALIVSRLSGIGFSFTVHAHDLFVRRELLGWKLHEADFVRVISDHNSDFLQRRYPDVAKKLRVIPVGVDPDRYRGGEVTHSESPEPPLILCVAALEEYKGVDVLIEACGQLAMGGVPFRCEVVGTGESMGELRHQIEELGLQESARLVGGLPQDQVTALLWQADLVVQPSRVARDGQKDGIPVALMEALAAGVPVVASELSGIPELVRDGHNGILVPPEDPGALATALAGLLRDEKRRLEMGRAGRVLVHERFRLAHTARQLREELRPVSVEPSTAITRLACCGAEEDEEVAVISVHRSTDAVTVEVLAGRGSDRERRFVRRHLRRPGESRLPGARAAREAAVLEWLGSIGSTGATPAAPALWTAQPRRGIVVTRDCAGVRLDRLLREARVSNGHEEACARALRAVSAAGRWLADLQRLRPPELPGDEIPDRMPWGEVEDSDGGGDPLVASHGDYWPGNLLLVGDQVVATDLEGFGMRPRGWDAAWFLAHMELYLRWPWQTGLRGRLREAFVRAWSHGAETNGEALARWEMRAAAVVGRSPMVPPDARRRSLRLDPEPS